MNINSQILSFIVRKVNEKNVVVKNGITKKKFLEGGELHFFFWEGEGGD